MKHILSRKHRFLFALLLGAGLLASCSSEEEALDLFADIEGIKFTADIADQPSATRAGVQAFPVSRTYYPCKFYVRMEGTESEEAVEKRNEIGVYSVPVGYQGILLPDGDNKGLLWYSRTTPHDFWAWTMPQDPEFDPGNMLEEGYEDIPLTFRSTTLRDDLQNNSPTSWKEGSFQNGKVLEPLIGTYSGPYSYNRNGLYVPLQFRHMTSKVLLRTFNVVNNVSGTTNQNLKGVFSIYGAPTDMVIRTNPLDEDGNKTWVHLEPQGDWDYNPTSYLSYAITNNPTVLSWEGFSETQSSQSTTKWLDCWYLPPELDFSRLSYKIELYQYKDGQWIPDETHGNRGCFYGDFSKIKFSRSSNGYDDTKNKGSDVTTLHAGEYMQLTIYLYESGNPSVQGEIIDWKSYGDRTGRAYTHQGIYTAEEMMDISHGMYVYGQEMDRDVMEVLFQTYGSGRDTGDDPDNGEYPDYEAIYGKELKIFELFDDIGVEYGEGSSGAKINTEMYLDRDYILDGRGHTINMSTVYVFTGNLRNVYLHHCSKSSSGVIEEYMAYIDNKGYLWKVDLVTGEMIPAYQYDSKTGANLGQYCVNKPGYKRNCIWLRGDMPYINYYDT